MSGTTCSCNHNVIHMTPMVVGDLFGLQWSWCRTSQMKLKSRKVRSEGNKFKWSQVVSPRRVKVGIVIRDACVIGSDRQLNRKLCQFVRIRLQVWTKNSSPQVFIIRTHRTRCGLRVQLLNESDIFWSGPCMMGSWYLICWPNNYGPEKAQAH